MGTLVMIIGLSGSGKSYSLVNCKPDKWCVLSVSGKRFPFKNNNKLQAYSTNNYDNIEKILAKNTFKAYAIDDSQFLMRDELFSRSRERGYDKWNDFALNWHNLQKTVKKFTDDDTVVYLLHHAELAPDGIYKAKTLGKMIDNYDSPESNCEVVLFAQNIEDKYVFHTQGRGLSTAKSPEGMFPELEIANDLEAVDNSIREYWNLSTVNKNK